MEGVDESTELWGHPNMCICAVCAYVSCLFFVHLFFLICPYKSLFRRSLVSTYNILVNL